MKVQKNETNKKTRCQYCSKEIHEKDVHILEIPSCCSIYTLRLCKECYEKFSGDTDKNKIRCCYSCY